MGQVVAVIAIIFLCYVAFMGLAYLWEGRLMAAAAAAAVEAMLLIILSILVQRFKATGRRFGRMIIGERIAVAVTLLACLPTLVPFTHFFTVYGKEDQVSSTFHEAIDEVTPMFDCYEAAAEKRIKAYAASLDKALKTKKGASRAGFDRHTEGKPDDGDRIIRNNMEATLRLQLLPPTFTAMRRQAGEWTAKAAAGATTLNPFLVGNTGEIRGAVTAWKEAMDSLEAKSLYNEPSPAVTDSLVAFHWQKADRLLGQVADLCSQRTFPPLHALLLCAACWALLFLPYWLQQRHSKSWEEFWPAWLRRDKQLPPERDIHQVTTVKMDWSKPATPPAARHTEAEKFRKAMEQAADPVQYVRQCMADGLSRQQLLAFFAEDHNLMDAATVKGCVDQRLFTTDQLAAAGIDPAFIDMLGTQPEDVLPDADTISQLPDATTEVYLWGIPSSGKTCAIGAVLAAAREKVTAHEAHFDTTCQGSQYMAILERMFPADGACITLPGRTPVSTNYAMRLDLDDWQHRRHPITLIDMAGELFCAILWRENGLSHRVTERHQRALAEFEKILVKEKTEHQKFHFFIIEYGAQDKKYKGFDQDTYLESGLQYLYDNHVLRDATQGIFVIVTKTDKAKPYADKDGDTTAHLQAWLRTYYPNFLNLLDKYCNEFELCGGHAPDPIPFHLGEVCFNNYCRLSTERAKDVVKVLLARSKGFPMGWKGVLARWMGT